MAENCHEMVIEGPALLIKGFVLGLVVAHQKDPHVVLFADELPFKCEGWMEQLAEWVKLQPRDSHLIVDCEIYEPLRKAFDAAREIIGLRVLSDKEVAQARFDFSYKAYSKHHAAELDLVMQSIEGVNLPKYKTWLRHDPSAKGNELYSPIHEFEFTASGTAQGPVTSVLRLYTAAKEHNFIAVQPINLEYV